MFILNLCLMNEAIAKACTAVMNEWKSVIRFFSAATKWSQSYTYARNSPKYCEYTQIHNNHDAISIRALTVINYIDIETENPTKSRILEYFKLCALANWCWCIPIMRNSTRANKQHKKYSIRTKKPSKQLFHMLVALHYNSSFNNLARIHPYYRNIVA